MGFPTGAVVKNREDPLGRRWQSPGKEWQDSCMGNPMDGEAWWLKVLRVANSQTGLNPHTQSYRNRLPWACPQGALGLKRFDV